MKIAPPSGPSDASRNPIPRARRTGIGGWLGGLGIALLFVALRWNSYDAPLIRDEGEYAYAAQLLRHGIVPYTHSFLQKPPMVIYSYALAGAIMPNIFWAPRILAYLFVALATLLLGLIARREFGIGHALPAMWLMTLMVPMPEIQQFTANTEMFLLLPLMATVAVYVRSRATSGKACHWLIGGFLAAVTLLYKYTAFPVLALVFIAWSIDEWRAAKNLRQLARLWLVAILGGVIASAAILVFFLRDHGLQNLWDCTVAFNRAYAASGNFGTTGLRNLTRLFWSDWRILCLLLGVVVFQRRPRTWFWIGMFLIACLSTNASIYGHYYLLIMPFWALLAAVAINQLSAWINRLVPKPLPWLPAVITAVAVTLACESDASIIRDTKAQFVEDRLNTGNPFPESELVAQQVAQITSPDDYVLVAGSEPQILYYAHRFSPTRFVIVYPLMIPTPLAAGYQHEAIREIEAHPPAVVVVSYAPSSWLEEPKSPLFFDLYVRQLLRKYYHPVGGYVAAQPSGHWEEPLTPEGADHASLVVFKREAQPSTRTE